MDHITYNIRKRYIVLYFSLLLGPLLRFEKGQSQIIKKIASKTLQKPNYNITKISTTNLKMLTKKTRFFEDPMVGIVFSSLAPFL